jgi:hypothetical protein
MVKTVKRTLFWKQMDQCNKQESLPRERYMMNSTNIRLDCKYFEEEKVLNVFV